MSTRTVRRTAAAGLAVFAILASTGCSRHGEQSAPTQAGQPGTSMPAGDSGNAGAAGTESSPAPAATANPSQEAAAAATALGTAIDHAGAAASDQSSDLSQSTGSAEGDPTQ